MLKEDAPNEKPPEKTEKTTGKVETVAVPVPGCKNWYNTTINGQPTIMFIRKIDHVTPVQRPDDKEKTTHSYMNKTELKEARRQEANQPKDPCEEQMECIQDKESQEVDPEFNWKHKDEIKEAEGPIIDPKREWTEGYIPAEESKTEEPNIVQSHKTTQKKMTI